MAECYACKNEIQRYEPHINFAVVAPRGRLFANLHLACLMTAAMLMPQLRAEHIPEQSRN